MNCYFILKCVVSGIIVALVSETAKRNPGSFWPSLGGLFVAMAVIYFGYVRSHCKTRDCLSLERH
jgi:hypothetical protein